MARRRVSNPVARLWDLSWEDDRISCAVYRAGKGLELRLRSGRKTLLAEPFELGPRMLSRVEMLKQSLKRRGWRDRAAD
jgi:hypothetical protein